MDIMGSSAGKIRQPRQHGNSGRDVRLSRFGRREWRRGCFDVHGFKVRCDLRDAILDRGMRGEEVQPGRREPISKKQMACLLGSRVF